LLVVVLGSGEDCADTVAEGADEAVDVTVMVEAPVEAVGDPAGERSEAWNRICTLYAFGPCEEPTVSGPIVVGVTAVSVTVRGTLAARLPSSIVHPYCANHLSAELLASV